MENKATPDRAIINSLLEIREGDERAIDNYLTGLLMPFSKPYGDLVDDKAVHFAIQEADVKKLIKAILNANFRHIEYQLIANGK